MSTTRSRLAAGAAIMAIAALGGIAIQSGGEADSTAPAAEPKAPQSQAGIAVPDRARVYHHRIRTP